MYMYVYLHDNCVGFDPSPLFFFRARKLDRVYDSMWGYVRRRGSQRKCRRSRKLAFSQGSRRGRMADDSAGIQSKKLCAHA